MRQFGNDAPEFLSFQLEGSDTVYSLPLAASLPARELIEMQKSEQAGTRFEWQVDLLKKYIGEAADELRAGTIKAIFDEWIVESGKSGASVGESEASSE